MQGLRPLTPPYFLCPNPLPATRVRLRQKGRKVKGKKDKDNRLTICCPKRHKNFTCQLKMATAHKEGICQQYEGPFNALNGPCFDRLALLTPAGYSRADRELSWGLSDWTILWIRTSAPIVAACRTRLSARSPSCSLKARIMLRCSSTEISMRPG